MEKEPLKKLQVEAAERATMSLGFKYVRTEGALKYNPKLKALAGDTNVTLSFIIGRSKMAGVPLSDDELLRELEAYAYHETLHGFAWERLGPLKPARYIPEEYWNTFMTNKLYGSPKFENSTFVDYATKKLEKPEDWRFVLRAVLSEGVFCVSVPPLVRALRYHSKQELSEVSRFFEALKNICERVYTWTELTRAEGETRETFKQFKIPLSEETCL
jgi:hypothetical protein